MYKIYFAGDLFDHKHLTGNIQLAIEIDKYSDGYYQPMLPQDWEATSVRDPIVNRNKDIAAVMSADLALFNFDGTDLDSGTVVEFMIAKMLDIPAILLRTDFRAAGDSNGIDWNLMAIGYPRSVVIKHNALALYRTGGIGTMHGTITESVIQGFDKVLQEKTLFSSYQEAFFAYQHVIKMCGSGLEKLISQHQVHELLGAKIKNNIYSFAQDFTTSSMAI